MLYLMILIFSIIVGLLRGGELENLYHITIEGLLFFSVALLLRAVVWFSGVLDLMILLEYNSILIVISYLFLIIAVFQNMKLPGFKYTSLGILINLFVILLNGGKMPVLLNQRMIQNMGEKTILMIQEQKVIHSLANNRTLFAFLGDVISLPKPFGDTSILSVGDILIFIGLFIMIQKIMVKEDDLKHDSQEMNEIEEGISL